jgi:phage tail sheath protein FI
VNVRRLFIMLRRAIHAGTQWVSFEPNTPDTWSLLEREISLFLRDVWMKGYFAGGSAEDSFLVKCDRETNPPESVDVGRMVTEIRVAPALPAEYILFSIEQQTGELNRDET